MGTSAQLTPPYLIVTYNSGQSITVPINDTISTLVGLKPGELVQVTVQYPPNQALQIVNLEALDGGSLLPPVTIDPNRLLPPGPYVLALQNVEVLPISVDGTLSFAFQAGRSVGLNQVSLVDNGYEIGLQFWVLDMVAPQNNPPAATADNPNY